jgi:uncharacterized repeat protein (TIGR03803 family)
MKAFIKKTESLMKVLRGAFILEGGYSAIYCRYFLNGQYSMSETILHFLNGTDGSNPYSSVLYHNGTLYGTTAQGGGENVGTLFSHNLSSGTFTVLHSFNGAPTDGALSYASVIYESGILFGTTSYGGDNDQGTLFAYELSSSIFTILYSFNGFNGSNPNSAVVYLDGILYGNTYAGGDINAGTLFAYELSSGVITTLHSFAGTPDDGAHPYASLIYQNGVFYGSTNGGGVNNNGSLFSYHLDTEIFTTLYSFGEIDGSSPYGSLVYRDGILYGGTPNGGEFGFGTLFGFDLSSGTLTILYTFLGNNGAYCFGSVIYQDGVLYGTTIEGGAYANGTLFRFDLTSGIYTNLYSFVGTSIDGAYPFCRLIYQDGLLYGTTNGGGNESNTGTLFSFDLHLPISDTCFPAGTLISCDQGNISIDKINPLKHTIHSKPITAITRTISQDTYLICFEKNVLGKDCPNQRTVMSKNHKILFRGKMTEAYKFLGHFENVKKVEYKQQTLYNVLMEKHDLINVNNLVCETLHPNNIVAKLHNSRLKQKEKNEIILRLNESIHQKDPISYARVARRIGS